MTADATVEQLREQILHDALKVALTIGRHGVPAEADNGICAELVAMATATSQRELRSVYLGLSARLAAAGIEPPPRSLH